MKQKDFDFRIWDNGHLIAGPVVKKYGRLGDYSSDCDVELWSGFYDECSRKIFDGDIVKYMNKMWHVKFEKSTFLLIAPDMDEELQIDCAVCLQNIYENRRYKDKIIECIRVVGNIHE